MSSLESTKTTIKFYYVLTLRSIREISDGNDFLNSQMKRRANELEKKKYGLAYDGFMQNLFPACALGVAV